MSVADDRMNAADPDLLATLRRTLGALPCVRAAWLFGSRGRGRARPDSDLDVAVLFSSALDGRGRHLATLEVIEALTVALGALGEKADILDLADAGAAVAFNAVREGICVVDRGDGAPAHAVARIARVYDDDAPRRAILLGAARSVAQGG